MLEAVPPMNFARIDPGESGDRSVIAPNKIVKKINKLPLENQNHHDVISLTIPYIKCFTFQIEGLQSLKCTKKK